ncbi:MAG: RNA pseudouridine synthase [Candidatus Omnitrophota bacterium]
MIEPKVIFEDDWLIAVDKPPGILVVPTPKKEKHTLTAIVNTYLEKNNPNMHAYPVHRLDRDTSGIIIYAKDKATQAAIMRLFLERKIKKTYIAFVHGRLKKMSGLIDNKIPEHDILKSAITKYQVLKDYSNYVKVLVRPITGRTNQIRIHFKQIGHPLVGERKFAFAKDYSLKFRRVALHAKSIEFVHPVTKRYLFLETELTKDLRMLDS